MILVYGAQLKCEVGRWSKYEGPDKIGGFRPIYRYTSFVTLYGVHFGGR